MIQSITSAIFFCVRSKYRISSLFYWFVCFYFCMGKYGFNFQLTFSGVRGIASQKHMIVCVQSYIEYVDQCRHPLLSTLYIDTTHMRKNSWSPNNNNIIEWNFMTSRANIFVFTCFLFLVVEWFGLLCLRKQESCKMTCSIRQMIAVKAQYVNN